MITMLACFRPENIGIKDVLNLCKTFSIKVNAMMKELDTENLMLYGDEERFDALYSYLSKKGDRRVAFYTCHPVMHVFERRKRWCEYWEN